MNEKPWEAGNNDAFSTLSTSLMNLVEQARSTRKVHGFLKSLHFKQIKARQFEVKPAHVNTFEWIFEEGKLQFLQWLRFPNNIFWVGGKAGSGKSTLMKFLCGHHRTRALLGEWAGQQSIIIASHFFWSAGTSMQKSQEGLLRSLLFQILIHSPDLIPIICPNRWSDKSLVSFHSLEPWPLSDLFQAFKNLASMKQLRAKFCLFIDGLDEYDGEHADIIRIIKILAQSPHIKLCVSSRPWTVFVDAFDRSKWKLYLQDLTRNDIRLYIKDNLEEDPRFQELKNREAIGSERLVQQIIKKAQGVFLWVYLVVRSLLRGLTNRDDMSDLERRLAELPGHLETYFKHMLDTIEDVYQQQTARTFRIMANASATLPLMALHFIDQERRDPNYAIWQEIQSVSPSEIVDIVETKRRQLNARCKDLIEVTKDSNEPLFFQYRAGFLHRTVMDFLQTNDMLILMSTRAGPDFNPHVSLCRSYLAQVKSLPAACQSEPLILRNLVFGTLQYAQDLEISHASVEAEVLDELDRTITFINRNDANPWSGIIPGDDCKSLLAIAVRAGLYIYVEGKVKECPAKLERSSGTPLLCHALKRGISISKDSGSDFCWSYEIDLSMLRLLLNLGASPNKTNLETGKSIWLDFLRQCLVVRSKQRTADWDLTQFLHPDAHAVPPLSNIFEACELMILHGACSSSNSATSPYELYFPDQEGIQIIRECFTDEEARRLEGLYKHDRNPSPIKIPAKKGSTWWKLWHVF
jgi:hypothetical protein